jgi:hypothetical protein
VLQAMYEQLKDEKIEQLEMLLSDQDNISMDARRCGAAPRPRAALHSEPKPASGQASC